MFRHSRFVILLCFFASGATGLLYESIWVRILGLSYGNTTLAVSAVVSAFMAGLAAGSYWMGSAAHRCRRPLRIYGLLELGIGLYCAATPTLLHGARNLYIAVYRESQPGVGWATLLQFGLSVAVIFFPTVLMGATLPVLSAGLVQTMGGVTRTVGRLYAINTFGAVVGAFLAGFVALPAIGMRATVFTAATLNVIIGILVYGFDRWLEAGELVGQPSQPGAREVSPAGSPAGEWRAPARTPLRRPGAGAPTCPGGSPPIADPPPPGVIAYLLCGFFLTGFASMVCQVGWTRVLCMVIGSSIYGFAIILTGFLLGLALGSLLFSILYAQRRAGDPPKVGAETFGAVAALIGLTTLALVAVFPGLPFLFLSLFARFSRLPLWRLEALQFAVIFILVGVPTLLMGTTFPIAAKICTDRFGLVSVAVGRSYAANTAGCILGSALTGLVLIPTIGIRASLMAASAVYVAVGCGGMILGAQGLRRGRPNSPKTNKAGPKKDGPTSLRSGGPSRDVHWGLIAAPLVAVATLIGILILPAWSRAALISGVYRTTSGAANVVSDTLARVRGQGIRVLYYKEGSIGTVSVTDHGGGHIALAVNGKVDASTGKGDMYTQHLVAHLPLLLAPEPKNVLVIGLGSGSSAGSALLYPSVERVDCVEIEPAVVPAARLFGQINHGVFENPRFHLSIADGRSYIAASSRKYDVIISEPSNPWIAGVSNVFSREHYEACKRVLGPGGLVCQWVQGYSLDWPTFTLLLATFARSFPHCTLWFSTTVDFMLIGSEEPLTAEPPALEAKIASIPEVKSDLDLHFVGSAGGILSCFLLGEEEIREVVRGSPIHTDDLPLLEFWAPKGLYLNVGRRNFDALWGERRPSGPPTRGYPSEPAARQANGALPRALPWADLARPEPSRQVAPPGAVGETELARERPLAPGAAPRPLARGAPPPNQAARLLLDMARSYFHKDLNAAAETSAREALKVAPRDPEAYTALGRALVAQKDWPAAQDAYETALAIDANYAPVQYYYGLLLAEEGQVESARVHLERAVKLAPGRASYRRALEDVIQRSRPGTAGA